ncbi:MAG: GNAT family N-acetyltransferase [Sphingobacteriales bacterium 41-5]|nr:MAG: GNAT family N-acetyltransferase [Niabella sp. SCN 42-15]OJU24290.1 MAG: GNAT family N-acetyltransferase [Sphingobacteriales bacterium 41-5]
MTFKKATNADAKRVWQILQEAIATRKADGSNQWQDGYPNPETIANDIEPGYGYVLMENQLIIAYAAVIFDIEPAYENIEGKWLSNGAYVVVHRVAVTTEAKGRGIATIIMKKIEELALSKNVGSIKVDTNFDNVPMLKILDKLGYSYCGEVYFRGSPRRAFEKLLM